MSDNDNEKLVTLDDLRDERLSHMTPEEQLASRKTCAEQLARLDAATWSRYMRRVANMERPELARKLGMSDQELELFELGKSEKSPTVAEVILIADLCGLHFLGDIKTELKTKVICTPQFEQQYRDLTKTPEE